MKKSVHPDLHSTGRNSRGFTLVELMIALALVAILSTLAAPSFNLLIQRSRVNAHFQQLFSSLLLARTEATKRGVRVSLCHSAAPEAATPVCGGAGSNWATGWLVFVDNTQDALNVAGTLDGSDVVLRVSPPLRGATIIPAPAAFTNSIGFIPTGRASNAGSFRVCLGQSRRQVNISTTGRVTPQAPALADNPVCDA